MNDTRIEALERRVQSLEDRLAIYQLLATYGPGVDSLSRDAIVGMWTQDGTYEIFDSRYDSAQAVGAMLNEDRHRGWVNAGCGHVMSLPHLVISGDTAVATGYARIYVNQGDHWRVERLSASRWELVRTPAGWKVKNRINRPLHGAAAARELLARELGRLDE